MRRADALAALLRPDQLVISGVGATSAALWALGPHPAHIYNMDFAYPAAVALGLALARPDRPVLCVEGEGSATAGVASWYAVAREAPANLTVVVFDNGVYGTGPGTIASPTGDGVDIAQLAQACGIKPDHVHRPADRDDVRRLGADIAAAAGFRFVHIVVDRSDVRSHTRPQVGMTFTEAAIRFELHLRGIDATGTPAVAGAR